eukprot:7573989-Alexandrium_andersonii.AAC.1
MQTAHHPLEIPARGMAPRGTLGAAHVRELAEVGRREGPAAPLERGDGLELRLQAEPHAVATLHRV